MQDIYTMLSTLRRPRLLISAARHGLIDYERTRHLKKLLQVTSVPTPGVAAMRLMELEAMQNWARVENDATYSIGRHIEVLIALMSEADLMRPRVEG